MRGAKLTQPGPCLKDLPTGGRRDTPVGSSHQQGTVADAVGTEARGKEMSHQEPGRVQKRELGRKERKWWGGPSADRNAVSGQVNQKDCRNMLQLNQERSPLEDRGWCGGGGWERGNSTAS